MKQDKIILAVVVIIVLLNLAISGLLYSNNIETNKNIELSSLEVQSQVLRDLDALQDSFDEKINLTENVQIKLIDEISLIKRQLTTQQLDQENDLKNLQKEIIKAQASSSSDFSLLAEKTIKSVVSIKTNVGSGSGVFISNDGTIVTNNHVLRDVKAAVVVTHDKQTHSVTLLGSDTIHDIAVIKIDSDVYEKLDWADSDDAKIGQRVLALGNPRGLDFSVTEGIISAKRDIDGIAHIQTDVPINPGNSGGPLVTTDGKILGINTFKFAGSEGLGFALSSNTASRVVSDILKS